MSLLLFSTIIVTFCNANSDLENGLSSLFKANDIKKIAIEANKKIYKENESLSFIIDTKGEKGYLYIIAVDKSDVTFFLPNKFSPLSELKGRHKFPEDFIVKDVDISATKKCKKCPREETNIYAVLSKKPIVGIKNMTGEELLNFIKPTVKFKTYSRSFNFREKSDGKNKDFFIGKLNLVVE